LETPINSSAEKMKLENDFWLHQDNDFKHTCALAKKYFSNDHTKLIRWPSKSPDLNVIEHVWTSIKKEYAKSSAINKKMLLKRY
jgi:transposase